jgi:hypothetical protein
MAGVLRTPAFHNIALLKIAIIARVLRAFFKSAIIARVLRAFKNRYYCKGFARFF